MKAYAGIGSRKTPPDILAEMTSLGMSLGKSEWILRSGAADGADSAFEEGCDIVGGWKEIYLPWRGFNDHTSEFYNIPEEAYKIAATIHPAWNYLKPWVKSLHARNCQQVLGRTLDDPVEMVICWTPKGKTVGGTVTAINLALSRGIKVVNLAEPGLDIEMVDKIMHNYFNTVSDEQFAKDLRECGLEIDESRQKNHELHH